MERSPQIRAEQPLTAVQFQMLRRLIWTQDQSAVTKRDTSRNQCDIRCRCPFDRCELAVLDHASWQNEYIRIDVIYNVPGSDRCTRAQASRASFVTAILEEDVHRLDAFASQFVEEKEVATLYRILYSEAYICSMNKNAPSTGTAGCKTGLMLAASKGLAVSVECLLGVMQSDHSINIADAAGMTALHMAAQQGYADIVSMLVRASAQCSLRCEKQLRAKVSGCPLSHLIALSPFHACFLQSHAGVSVQMTSPKWFFLDDNNHTCPGLCQASQAHQGCV
jgi:hypothetical protein